VLHWSLRPHSQNRLEVSSLISKYFFSLRKCDFWNNHIVYLDYSFMPSQCSCPHKVLYWSWFWYVKLDLLLASLPVYLFIIYIFIDRKCITQLEQAVASATHWMLPVKNQIIFLLFNNYCFAKMLLKYFYFSCILQVMWIKLVLASVSTV
jgi:hypothetical protein